MFLYMIREQDNDLLCDKVTLRKFLDTLIYIVLRVSFLDMINFLKLWWLNVGNQIKKSYSMMALPNMSILFSNDISFLL